MLSSTILLCLLCYTFSVTLAQEVDLPKNITTFSVISHSVLEGIDFFQEPNSTDCFQSLLDLSQQTATTDQNSTRLDTALQVSSKMAFSLANLTLKCPAANLNYIESLQAHFSQFSNSSYADIIESFLVGLVSSSFEIRQTMVLLEAAVPPDLEQITLSLSKVLKNIVLFDSVYATTPQSLYPEH